MLAAAVSVVVAACGGGGDDTEAGGPAAPGGAKGEAVEFKGDLASAASENCKKVDSGRVRMSWQISGGNLPAPVEASFTGEFDNKAKRSHLTMDLAPLLKALPNAGGGEAGGEAALAAGLAQIEIITDGDTTYMKSGFLSALLGGGGGKAWVKFTKGASEGSGGTLNFSNNLFGGNVCDFTAVLSSVGEVRKVGTETVDGVATVHFQATVDLTKAAPAAGASEAEQQSFRDFIAASGLQKVPVEVWVGADGIFRRMRMSVDTFDLGAVFRTTGGVTTGSVPAEKVKMTVTVSFTDVNEPVTIELPPPDQVAEPGGLFGSIPSIPSEE